MKNCPTAIFKSMCGISIDDAGKRVFDQFQSLSTLDPLSDSFKNAYKQFINGKYIKEVKYLPRFSMSAQYSFKNYQKFEQCVDISANLELWSRMGRQIYTDKGTCIPILDSDHMTTKLHMAYQVMYTIDTDSRTLPALTPNPKVNLCFG
jgi:hypothetical protein